MEKEEQQLPLARMVTINKPWFWIFLGACLVLYICSWQYTQNLIMSQSDHGRTILQFVSNSHIIILCVLFVGLVLNVIALNLKGKPIERNFMICTHFFEVAGIIAAALLIFLPR